MADETRPAADPSLQSSEGSLGAPQQFDADAARPRSETPDRLTQDQLDERDRQFGRRKPMGPPLADDEAGVRSAEEAPDVPDVAETQVGDVPTER
jgi:hypothetical protein